MQRGESSGQRRGRREGTYEVLDLLGGRRWASRRPSLTKQYPAPGQVVPRSRQPRTVRGRIATSISIPCPVVRPEHAGGSPFPNGFAAADTNLLAHHTGVLAAFISGCIGCHIPQGM